MELIIVERINIDNLLSSRVQEVKERDENALRLRNERIKRLMPIVSQAMFGMVDIHNKAIEVGKKGIIPNVGIIKNINDYVSDIVNMDYSWGSADGYKASSPMYTNAYFSFYELKVWLNDNFNCMIYTNNPVYQIHGALNVKDWLEKMVVKYID